MDLKTQIALQDAAWKNLKITTPSLDWLLSDFSKFVSKDLPSSPADVERFLSGEFAKFLEPSPGFFRSHDYPLAKIEATFGKLTLAEGLPFYFRDSNFGFYWSQTETSEFGMRFQVYKLIGERLE